MVASSFCDDRKSALTVNFLDVKFSLRLHQQMADDDGTSRAEAVGHPGLFRISDQYSIGLQRKGAQSKLQFSH